MQVLRRNRTAGWWACGRECWKRRFTWGDIWQPEPQSVELMIQAVYNILPSPANLHVWVKCDYPSCPLCPGRGSLGCCSKAVGESLCHWHHNQFLNEVALTVSKALANYKQVNERKITLIKAGVQPHVRSGTWSCSTPQLTGKWELTWQQLKLHFTSGSILHKDLTWR